MTLEIVTLILAAVNVVLLVVLLLRPAKKADYSELTQQMLSIGAKTTSETQQAVMTTVSTMGQSTVANLDIVGDNIKEAIHALKTDIGNQQKSHSETLNYLSSHINTRQEAMQQTTQTQLQNMQQTTEAQLKTMQQTTEAQLKTMLLSADQQNKAMQQSTEAQLHAIQANLAQQLKAMSEQMTRMENDTRQAMRDLRQENTQKLEEIRGTVDEKLQTTLQKRISESFQTVSQQLEQVYKGIGEMQRLATDVGSLKQVLSGVKTRGILGEIQLKAILADILSPEQYDENVPTIPGSTERVEFAVRLPGGDEGMVYLPIDSKFPGDTYMHLQDAQASGDVAAVAEARKALTTVLKKSAKDIRDKYVEPPYTTTFGILFLPFEGLYAEVVNMGLIEVLRRDYNINVAGPSTMAALLSSLQMGFRTLAIQKRSNEVWQVLGAVKTEFGKFEDVMKKMQTHLQQTSADLDSLIGTRSKAISRKLRQVQELDETDTRRLLDTEEM